MGLGMQRKRTQYTLTSVFEQKFAFLLVRHMMKRQHAHQATAHRIAVRLTHVTCSLWFLFLQDAMLTKHVTVTYFVKPNHLFRVYVDELKKAS